MSSDSEPPSSRRMVVVHQEKAPAPYHPVRTAMRDEVGRRVVGTAAAFMPGIVLALVVAWAGERVPDAVRGAARAVRTRVQRWNPWGKRKSGEEDVLEGELVEERPPWREARSARALPAPSPPPERLQAQRRERYLRARSRGR